MSSPVSPTPWPRRRRPSDPFADIGPDSFHVFVPAIMGVGLLFSVTSLFRDALRRTTRRSRERRIALATATTVDEVLGRRTTGRAALGLFPRRTYVATAIVGLVGGVALAVGGILQYASGEDVRHNGFVLALFLGAASASVIVGVGCAGVASRWPDVPPWALPMLRTLPLTYHPARIQGRPPRILTDGALVLVVAAAVLTWLAEARSGWLEAIDDPVSDAIAGMGWIRHLDAIDVFGSTVISLGSVLVIAASGFRCRVMALVYPAAFVFSWLSTELLQELVERTRPSGFGEVASFPSGHMVQAVFIAGLLPTALGVLFRLGRPQLWLLRGVLLLGAVATALIRIERQDHWPSDILAGALLGLTAVVGAHWVVAHRWWHQRCPSCPWSEHPEVEPWGRALFDLPDRLVHWIGRLGVAGAIGASLLLGVGTLTVGLPARQADDGLGPEISEPAQITLAVLVGVAGLLALRSKALAAFVIAVCASALGLLASIEYEPVVAFVITALLLVPAVILWLAWQHHATIGAIFALAALTASSLTATALGSREIHGQYFGPTHPGSAAASLVSDAGWLWLGGVTSSEATLVAGGFEHGERIRLTHWREDVARLTELDGAADEFGVVRFRLEGLEPATEHHYSVDRAGDPVDLERPDRSFVTFADGPQDLVIAAGACARTGSNAAVFDQIVASEPDLFLQIGDLHYADLETSDPAEHIGQYGKALSQPGQSALYSAIPTAYVWDDHDFGPNDADSSSPSRAGALAAYRAAVPSYGVDPDLDAPISQAFTVGRVRVVMTDTRSQRTDDTMLGPAQLDWLVDELVSASRTHAVVVWANPTPWIATGDGTGDDWSSQPEERRHIADALVDAGVANVVMVSGDAHMVAIDDGTNSGFGRAGLPGPPVLHAAPLDRRNSVKGGPYSHGTVAGPGQFGVVEILDDGGDTVLVRLRARNWEGQELLALDLEMPVGAGVRP